MKKLASFLMPLLMLPVTGTFSQIACAVPNYDIHRYEDISFTGYIKCDLKKFDDRDEFYRLSLTDNSGQITVVDIVADSDKNKDSYEKILQICPAGSRCTITGDLETREQQFINFINIKNIVKETEYHIPAGAVSEIDTGINYNHVKLYENVELTGYIKCTIEHFGTPAIIIFYPWRTAPIKLLLQTMFKMNMKEVRICISGYLAFARKDPAVH